MTHRPSLDLALRALIGAFCERTGTSPRRFGVEALGDPGFMASLDRGRGPGLKTVDRLLAFMGLPTAARSIRSHCARETRTCLCREPSGEFVMVSCCLRKELWPRRASIAAGV